MDKPQFTSLVEDVRFLTVAEILNITANLDQLDHTSEKEMLLICLTNYQLLWDRTNLILKQQEEILKILKGGKA